MLEQKQMTDAVIRKAGVADLDRIQEIAVAAWTPIYEHRRRNVLGEEIFQDLWGGWRSVQRVKREDLEDRVVVTELNGRIVGFATWRLLNPRAGEITANGIDPAFQGRGLGTRQIRWMLQMFKSRGCECANVFTGLDPAHAPARGQYYAVGLRLPISTSVFMNPLRFVADAPSPVGLRVAKGAAEHALALKGMVEAVWGPILAENRRVTDGLHAICGPDELAKRKETVAKRLAEGPDGVRVVLDGGCPVGFCLLELNAAKGMGAICQLGVLPSSRNRGAATALAMDAFRVFRERGMRYVQLLTGPGENTDSARSFCHTLGLHREIPSVWLFGRI